MNVFDKPEDQRQYEDFGLAGKGRMKTDNRQIILADRHDVTRLGLRCIVERSLLAMPSIAVREASKRTDLLQLLDSASLSVVFIDHDSFVVNENEMFALSERYPQTMWVMFSETLTDTFVRSLSKNRHFSIVMKGGPAYEIASALRCALTGERFLCHHIADILLAPPEEDAGLTATETEVLRLIAFGKSVKEIAAERNSSIHTITTHKKNIFRKLNVNTIYEATKYALRAGLVDMTEYCGAEHTT